MNSAHAVVVNSQPPAGNMPPVSTAIAGKSKVRRARISKQPKDPAIVSRLTHAGEKARGPKHRKRHDGMVGERRGPPGISARRPPYRHKRNVL